MHVVACKLSFNRANTSKWFSELFTRFGDNFRNNLIWHEYRTGGIKFSLNYQAAERKIILTWSLFYRLQCLHTSILTEIAII